ncbi:MAG: hypothetical protein QXR66_02740 [Thermoplasmatales archaeon]
MTVKERTGRRRYVYLKNASLAELKGITNKVIDAKLLNFKGLIVIRVRHDELPALRNIASKMNLKVDLVSGTLKSLKDKVSKIH